MLVRRPTCRRTWTAAWTIPSARALCLFKGNKDTLFRIRGANEPDTIGDALSSPWIRMLDVTDRYRRTAKGARVVL